MAPVIAGYEGRMCRVYKIEPGGFTAYYTYDGVLARVAGRGFEARLLSFPRRREPAGPAAPATPAPAAETAPEVAG